MNNNYTEETKYSFSFKVKLWNIISQLIIMLMVQLKMINPLRQKDSTNTNVTSNIMSNDVIILSNDSNVHK